MPSADLCSRDDVKQYLGITGTTYDTTISRLVTAASEAVEQFTRRKFASATYTEYHDGGGSDRVVLLERPVISVTNIWDDPDREFDEDSVVEADEYVVDSARGIIILSHGRFFDGTRNVKVVYAAGHGVIQKDVAQAAIMLAAGWFREGREVGKTGTANAVDQEVKNILKHYREMVL